MGKGLNISLFIIINLPPFSQSDSRQVLTHAQTSAHVIQSRLFEVTHEDFIALPLIKR